MIANYELMAILQTAEMNVLRNIVLKTRVDHVRNRDMRHRCGIQETGEGIHIGRTEWNSHVSRVASDRIVLTAQLEGE
jgi:tyrosyl-tRNA synthetase